MSQKENEGDSHLSESREAQGMASCQERKQQQEETHLIEVTLLSEGVPQAIALTRIKHVRQEHSLLKALHTRLMKRARSVVGIHDL